jgi:hypothetical protein
MMHHFKKDHEIRVGALFVTILTRIVYFCIDGGEKNEHQKLGL